MSVPKALRSLNKPGRPTYQGDPVRVEGAKSHLRDKLRAGQKQEIEVEEVFELVKQHLERGDRREGRPSSLVRWGRGRSRSGGATGESIPTQERDAHGTFCGNLKHSYRLFRKIHTGNKNILDQSKNIHNDTHGNDKFQEETPGGCRGRLQLYLL